MKSFRVAAVVAGAIASVAAQTSSEAGGVTATPTGPVVQITFPGDVDSDSQQILVGSLIGTENQLTTVAIGCPAGTDSNDCPFDPLITVTAGPNTLVFALAGIPDTAPLTNECSFDSNGGACTVMGEAAVIDGTGTDTSIVTSTTTIAGSDLQTIPITITAGATAGLGGSSGASSTTSGGASSTTSAKGGDGSSSTSSPNAAKSLVPGSFGAALLGLAAIYL